VIVGRVPFANLALTLDDAALVARARTDDGAAFTALYRRHARYVAGVVYQLLGNDAELDDVLQETFLDAKNGLTEIEDGAAVRRWLVVIAIRRAHRLLARRRIRRFYASKVAEVSPRASDPRDARAADDLYEALDRLPVKLRIPWILARVGAMPLEKAADACEVSLATIKRRIAEAEARIERRLAE
jgi:RNA polymerase sigma-70 factor (ECF subfamily)